MFELSIYAGNCSISQISPFYNIIGYHIKPYLMPFLKKSFELVNATFFPLKVIIVLISSIFKFKLALMVLK